MSRASPRILAPQRPGVAPALIALALVAAVLAALLAPATARAADGGLVVIADARYQVLPAESRVHVTLDAVATSYEPDTADARVYYSGVTFAVPAGTANVAASAGGIPLATRIVEDADMHRVVEITFGRGVFYRQSYAYQVTFDLVDAGGDGTRDLRIGTSVVAFPVWAFGTEGEAGGTVRVELPGDYQAQVQGSEMAEARAGASRVLTAEPRNPFAFFAYVTADRPGAFIDTPVAVTTRNDRPEVVVRAWEDDPAWGERMSELMADGLPALERLIGVAYPHAGRLRVEEAAISRLGQYAGLYDRRTGVIQVRYDADANVALHEAAHVWFNDRLFPDRWIGEAWAEFYAVRAGRAIGETGFTWQLTRELRRSRIPLNDWGAVGRVDLEVEDFAYAATYHLARLVAERTDLAGLKRVWRAAASRQLSYLPPDGGEEQAARAQLFQPGWQRLLDLLEERTDASYADLWAEWVVNEEQQPLLAERAHARSRYETVVAASGDWQLPPVVRVDLGDWVFDSALAHLDRAEDVLAERTRIQAAARELDLEPSDRLRAAYESSLTEAVAHADLELTTLGELADAMARSAAEPDPLEALGLVGEDPSSLAAAAGDQYEDGQLGAARRSAREAVEDRDAAADRGRSRATLGAAALIGLDGLVLVGLSGAALWRRRRSLPATA